MLGIRVHTKNVRGERKIYFFALKVYHFRSYLALVDQTCTSAQSVAG